MCLQCTVSAVVIAENVLPGCTLMKSMHDDKDWPLGWYGLVYSNDPFMVFPTLSIDPKFSDDMLNAEAPETVAAENAHYKAVIAFREQAKLTWTTAGEIFAACVAEGYDRAVAGDIEFWLLDFISQRANDAQSPVLSAGAAVLVDEG